MKVKKQARANQALPSHHICRPRCRFTSSSRATCCDQSLDIAGLPPSRCGGRAQRRQRVRRTGSSCWGPTRSAPRLCRLSVNAHQVRINRPREGLPLTTLPQSSSRTSPSSLHPARDQVAASRLSRSVRAFPNTRRALPDTRYRVAALRSLAQRLGIAAHSLPPTGFRDWSVRPFPP